MIIQNGYIRFKRMTGGGLDAAGYPVGATETLSDSIDCQYTPRSMNLAGKNAAGEPHIRQSYTILIEDAGTPVRDETVLLYDVYGIEIGEFEVIQIKPLPSVGQIRLYV